MGPCKGLLLMKCQLCGTAIQSSFSIWDVSRSLTNTTQEQFAVEDFFALEMFLCERWKNVQLSTMVSRERMFEDYY